MLLEEDSFIRYLLNIKQHSKNTISSYQADLDDLDTFLNIIDKVSNQVDSFDLEEFKGYLHSKGLAKTTINRKISATKTYYDYLSRKGIITHNPTENLDGLKVKNSRPDYLTIAEANKLIRATEGQSEPFKSRDRLILLLFVTTGLRREELRSIQIKDIGSDNMLRVLGKGDKERYVGLNKDVRKSLNDYLKVRDSNSDYLFISRNGNQISKRALYDIVKKYVKKAKLEYKNISPHTLRHTAGTIIYGITKDIRAVQKQLGHSNINTTEIYTHIDNKEIYKGSEALEGLVG